MVIGQETGGGIGGGAAGRWKGGEKKMTKKGKGAESQPGQAGRLGVS